MSTCQALDMKYLCYGMIVNKSEMASCTVDSETVDHSRYIIEFRSRFILDDFHMIPPILDLTTS